VLGELRRKLVEIVRELDLATHGAEGVRDGMTPLHRDESSDRPPGALDDDLFTTLGEIDQPRELTLGLVHSDANHGTKIAST
jgi:hypothetical protein